MAESTPYVTNHSINTVGVYQEATKGTAVTGVTYLAIKGTLDTIAWVLDDDRQPHNNDDNSPIAGGQSRGLRKGTMTIKFRISSDLPSTDNQDISLFEMVMGSGSLNNATGVITPRTSSNLDSFTLWLQQTNFPAGAGSTRDNVFTGLHVGKLDVIGVERGDVVLTATCKFFDHSTTAPSTATLPAAPDNVGNRWMNWLTSDGAVTLTRAGTEARIKTWSLIIDNGDLTFIPKAGQRTAANYVPGMLKITGDLEFFVNDTEIYDAWRTDPNVAKTLEFDNSSGTWTVGEVVTGASTAATAVVVVGGATPLTLKRVAGQFETNERLSSTSASADADGVILDTSSIDFELVLSKNSGNEYLKLQCFNVQPTGSFNFSLDVQNPAMQMIRYPYEVYRSGNIKIDLKS